MKNLTVFALHAIIGLLVILPMFFILLIFKTAKVIYFSIRNLFVDLQQDQPMTVTNGLE